MQYLFIAALFFFFCHAAWLAGLHAVPDQGLNLGQGQGKSQIGTTRPPGKELRDLLLISLC